MYAGRGPNSKAAGDPPRLTALPSSPIRAVFLDIVGRRTGGEVMHSFTFVPNSSVLKKREDVKSDEGRLASA